MVQAADCDWTSVYCRNDFICNTTIINVYDPIDFCRYFFDWSLCYLYHILQSCDFSKRKKADEERIRNSREYKEECRKQDTEYDKKQEELDRKFKNHLDAFQKESDTWEKNYREWQKEKEKTIRKIKEDISLLESKRDRLYDNLNAIPVHYRKTEIIRYIYHAVSTSDYTIKEAIDLYDRNEQRKIDEARLREQQIYNQLQEEANAYADEMNDLQREANETAAKARRDMNIANAANIYQNHKKNKMLDRMNKK